jgi:hypothetical protein
MITTDELKAATKGTPWVPPAEEAETASDAGTVTGRTEQPEQPSSIGPRNRVVPGNGVVPGGSTLPDAPDFPTGSFPDGVRRYIEAAALAVRLPVDFVAVPFLSFAGAAMGNQYEIALNPDWKQRPNIWTLIVGGSGVGKSPAQDKARYPLDVLQGEAWDRYQELRDKYETDLREWKTTPKGEPRDDEPTPPILEHLFTTDTTTEALTMLCAQSPGIACYQDELTGFFEFNEYRAGKGKDEQRYLSLWSSSPLKIDRKSSPPLYVHAPSVSITGGLVPESLSLLTPRPEAGMIQRFGCSYPKGVKKEKYAEQSIPEELKKAIVETFRKLRNNPTEVIEVSLSAQAKAIYVEWYNENAERVNDSPPLIASAQSKLDNQALRYALVLHGLTYPDDASRPVSEETMLAALDLTEYFRAMSYRIFARFEDVGTVRIAGLDLRLDLRLRAAYPAAMTQTELDAALSKSVPAAERNAALERLAALTRARRVDVPAGAQGGRPTVEWIHVPEQPEQPGTTAIEGGLPSFEIDVGSVS